MTSSAKIAADFSIDDAFEIETDEDDRDITSPARFGTLNFDRKTNLSLPTGRSNGHNPSSELDESNLKYQNLQNDEEGMYSNSRPVGNIFITRNTGRSSTRSSQWSFSTISNTTQLSYRECFSWMQHPLIVKNKKVVFASFLLVIVGTALIFTGIGVQMNPASGVSSAIFFVPGFLLIIPGVYHVIFIYFAVRGRKGFRFFYLPYFEK
uniref:Transmembrane protein 134 n=1 Tax=Erpetoichthys calabaricus TaxID=27687 RepID=A0A8C4X951_ERPCA